MTGFFRGKGVSQVDEILVNGKRFSEKQLKEILKDVDVWDKKKIKES